MKLRTGRLNCKREGGGPPKSLRYLIISCAAGDRHWDGLPWSSSRLRECNRSGVERFGWCATDSRHGWPEGTQLISQGMATHSSALRQWHRRSPAVEFRRGGYRNQRRRSRRRQHRGSAGHRRRSPRRAGRPHATRFRQRRSTVRATGGRLEYRRERRGRHTAVPATVWSSELERALAIPYSVSEKISRRGLA